MNIPHNETSVHVETMYILSHAADVYASTKRSLEHNALSIDIYSGSVYYEILFCNVYSQYAIK